MTNIGIIGDGNVGSALTNGLTRGGHEVRTVGREPQKVKEVGQWADTLILAVPFGERENALRTLGDVGGKVIVDVTNALDADMGFAADPTKESGAEQLQRMAKGAKVVKAFNTVLAPHMDTGTLHGEKLTVLVAGDDEGAKGRVMELARGIGFDAVDAGPLKNARWVETLGYLNVQLAYVVGMGPMVGFRFVHEGAKAAGTGKPAATKQR